MKIFTFDTTLRDGTQGESVSFSVDDKLIIAQKLDELGIDYIEGGWPGSNPKDKDFFARAAELNLQHAKLTAFGSTRFAKNPVHEDPNVRGLSRPNTPVSRSSARAGTCTSTRARHHRGGEPRPHLRHRAYLKEHGKRSRLRRRALLRRLHPPIPTYALRTSRPRRRPAPTSSALRHERRHAHRPAGRDRRRSAQALRRRDRHPHAQRLRCRRGQHARAVEAGATHVQGCMNGYGERCGNANLAPSSPTWS
jgi:2-isopropylmalate synthase